MWAFLNIWCLLDSVLFPLLFVVFGGYQFIRKKIRNRKSKYEFNHFSRKKSAFTNIALCNMTLFKSKVKTESQIIFKEILTDALVTKMK